MKNKHILYPLMTMALLLGSCKKYLDQQPISTATDNTSWQSDGDANAGVAASYALIRAAFNAGISYYSYGDLYSGEFASSADFSYQNILTLNWGYPVPSVNNYDPLFKLRVYTPYYTAIAQSNRCLQFIANMPVADFTGGSATDQLAEKNHYLGEAYFTRAFSYFNLCRIWGDVPLVLDNTDATVSTEYARSPQITVLKQAIADLNKAIPYLAMKNNSSVDRNYRADKGIAYALLAHIYAWMGDYTDCNTACDQVINSGAYTLMPASNFTDIYKGQSAESIFEIAQNTVTEGTSVANNYTFQGATLTAPYIYGRTSPLWLLNESSLSIYTDPNDVRLTKCFTTYFNGVDSSHECIKYINIQTVNNIPSQQVGENNIVVFRLADIELLKAEALCATATDYSGALAIVNNIRSNRNAAPLTGIANTDMLQTVFDERGREMFLEGHRTFDLIRLERLNGIQQFGNIQPGEFTAGKYYWPVDPSLFINDSKLTQTSFWAGRVN